MVKICVWCGEPYEAVRSSQLTCSKPCQRDRYKKLNNWYKKMQYQEEKARQEAEKEASEKKRAKPKVSLIDTQAEARKLGLTYGQYVARHEYGMK